MAKVEYNSENCMECMCPSCQVQAKSECTLQKRPKWLEMQKEMNQMMMQKPGIGMGMGAKGGMSMPMQKEQEKSMEMAMLEPEQMIGLYCSSEIGKSKCEEDLDASQMCSCPTCLVWMKHGIKSQYYCTEGDADQRG